MRYVFVESGEIVIYPTSLPLNWRNISNLPAVDDERLRSFGWYPCRLVQYEGSMDGKVFVSSLFVLEGNEYVEYQQARDKTPEEIEAEIEAQWVNVRSRRNILLQNSDWTQLPDVDLSEELTQKWIDYRRDLRNITNHPDPFDLPWPTEPV